MLAEAGRMRSFVVTAVVLLIGAPAYAAPAVCLHGSYADISLDRRGGGYLQTDVVLGAADQACAPSDLTADVSFSNTISGPLTLELWAGDCADAAARTVGNTRCRPLGLSTKIAGDLFDVADPRDLFPGLDDVTDVSVGSSLWIVVSQNAVVVDVCQQPIHEERRHPAPPFDVAVRPNGAGLEIDWTTTGVPLATQTAPAGYFVLCARNGQPLEKLAVTSLPYSMCVPNVRFDRMRAPLERGPVAGIADGDPAYACTSGPVTDTHAALFPPDDESFQVVVVAFDEAGNATPSAVVDVPARHARGGCSIAGGRSDGTPIAWLVFATLVLAARRRYGQP
jgi:hypothetical protein